MSLPYLRKSLFQAAFIACYHNPVFSAYYQQKRAERKHHKVAVGVVATYYLRCIKKQCVLQSKTIVCANKFFCPS